MDTTQPPLHERPYAIALAKRLGTLENILPEIRCASCGNTVPRTGKHWAYRRYCCRKCKRIAENVRLRAHRTAYKRAWRAKRNQQWQTAP